MHCSFYTAAMFTRDSFSWHYETLSVLEMGAAQLRSVNRDFKIQLRDGEKNVA